MFKFFLFCLSTYNIISGEADMRKLILIIPVLVFFVFSCDMTTSSRIEGIWLSRGGDLSVMYEETLVLSSDFGYTLEKKQDGKAVLSKSGTWALAEEAVGDLEGEQRVIAFTPVNPKGNVYKKMYALENYGNLLVLGTYNLETGEVESQRFYKTGEAK